MAVLVMTLVMEASNAQAHARQFVQRLYMLDGHVSQVGTRIKQKAYQLPVLVQFCHNGMLQMMVNRLTILSIGSDCKQAMMHQLLNFMMVVVAVWMNFHL